MQAVLLPVLGRTLEENVTDFLPYSFQILGLLLDAAPSVKPLYQEFADEKPPYSQRVGKSHEQS
eukprot:1207478-Amphidinium_carterae.2